MGAEMTKSLGTLAATAAMHSAEDAWTTGYCVAITVPEADGVVRVDDPREGNVTGVQIDIPYVGVPVGSEKPFSAIVTHKFEGGQLHAPVTAHLNSGAVSVTPSGTKVPAPAAFRYKAPDQPYLNAVVTLETRSRRGVAKLVVALRTIPQGYRASWQDEGSTWSGIVCGLDRLFSVTVVTPGRDLEMRFDFEPTSPIAGNVSFDVTEHNVHWVGSGTYTVKGSGAEQLSLLGAIRHGSYTASGKTGYYDIPFDIPLTPLTGKECG